MAILKKFTDEEVGKIIRDSLDAGKRGDLDERRRLQMLLPLDPALAKAAADTYGKEYILSQNFDLSLADEKYGTGWMDEVDAQR